MKGEDNGNRVKEKSLSDLDVGVWHGRRGDGLSAIARLWVTQSDRGLRGLAWNWDKARAAEQKICEVKVEELGWNILT